MELAISKVEDLSKLKGWQIKGISSGRVLVDPCISFVLTHPAAEKPICLTITADVRFGRSGNVMVADALLHIHSSDVEIVDRG